MPIITCSWLNLEVQIAILKKTDRDFCRRKVSFPMSHTHFFSVVLHKDQYRKSQFISYNDYTNILGIKFFLMIITIL